MEEAVHIREELSALLAKACMSLRKWRSNSTDLLQTIPDIICKRKGGCTYYFFCSGRLPQGVGNTLAHD